jgi:hypothetical protein
MSTQIQITSSSGLTVGTTAITSGTTRRVLFQDGTILQQSANFVFDSSNQLVIGGHTGGAKLDVKAGGNTSLDIGLGVRNFGNTAYLFSVQGDGVANVLSRMNLGFSGMTTTGGALHVYAGNNNDFVSKWYNTAGVDIMNLRTSGNGAVLTLNNASGTAGITLNGIFSNALTFGAGKDIYFDTATGTKIGAATNQKFAFWNKTPIVQPTTAFASGTLISNLGTPLTNTDTIDGYTIQQIVKALVNVGLLA